MPRPIKFPTAPPMVNEMRGAVRSRLSGNATKKPEHFLAKSRNMRYVSVLAEAKTTENDKTKRLLRPPTKKRKSNWDRL